MKTKIKIYIFIVTLILGAFSVYNKSYATLECDPGQVECNDQCISECGGGMELDSSCSCQCPQYQDECNGGCYTQCQIGYSRDVESCECEMDTCFNGANNPPNCNQCPSGEDMCASDNTCYTSCQTGYSRDQESCDCVLDDCANGAIDPPVCFDCGPNKAFDPAYPYHCINYCDDPDASNYHEYEACEYNYDYCCNDITATNYDDECPNSSADPEKIEDNSGQCEYCTKENPNDLAICKKYWCPDPDANNVSSQEECDADFLDLECVQGTNESHCTYDTFEFCGDNVTPALNPETQLECNASIPEYRRPCVRNDDLCQYPDKDYCIDEYANNYETEAECQDGNININCIPHEEAPVCTYDDACIVLFL